MNTLTLGRSGLRASRLAYGCWRIAETADIAQTVGRRAVVAAFEAGYTLFDLADIYCGGESERLFGSVLAQVGGMRAGVLIATKCGIRLAGEPSPAAPFRYDFSAGHIIASCEGSLRRLGVDMIDLYQLHRPDWLMDPSEVAGAFEQLQRQGKVREFGVSNFRPSQVSALQKACPMRLVVNQVEISLACRERFEDGTLDQCVGEGITPMAWSPLAGGKLGDGARRLLPWQEGYDVTRLGRALEKAGGRLGVAPSVVALAWLLRHPSGIVPIVGSTRPEQIVMATRAADLGLGREDWYELLESARGERLP